MTADSINTSSNTARVMIAAMKSGSGKTLITTGLLRALKDNSLDPAAFKCGPDYIDPMFHRTVLGIPGGNLDSFFQTEDEMRGIISSCSSGYAVIEGVMGIYDGAATSSGGQGSCYDVARITRTPIILVMDVRGMGMTMLSVIRGILSDDTDRLIRGIILNRISDGYYERIEPEISRELERISLSRRTGSEEPADVRLIGHIPKSDGLSLESRHLGLKMPGEIESIDSQIDRAADLIRHCCDMDAIVEIMKEAVLIDTVRARECTEPDPDTVDSSAGKLETEQERGKMTLAVARDEAFCFYYEENLRLLRSLGISIRKFSPLHDAGLPEDADGILIGGGYPELYAEELAENTSMLESIRSAIKQGMPSLAECGGFMYLMEGIADADGTVHRMAGVLPGTSSNTGRLGRFGYITVTSDSPGGILTGLEVKGHEFHYFDSDNNGTDAVAAKPDGGRTWECMHTGPDHLWGFPHLYYPSCPELIRRLRYKMTEYREQRRDASNAKQSMEDFNGSII